MYSVIHIIVSSATADTTIHIFPDSYAASPHPRLICSTIHQTSIPHPRSRKHAKSKTSLQFSETPAVKREAKTPFPLDHSTFWHFLPTYKSRIRNPQLQKKTINSHAVDRTRNLLGSLFIYCEREIITIRTRDFKENLDIVV